MAAPSKNNKKRIITLFTISCVLFAGLTFRLGWIQVVNAQKYSDLAINQQTRDTPISAIRGTIYDRSMNELAINAPTYTVWVWPSELEKKDGDPEAMAALLSQITGLDPTSIKESLTKESSLVRVAKDLNLEQADQIRALINFETEDKKTVNKLPGISVVEETKRYYPAGTFASHIIGHTTDDSTGISGIELKYNDYLSGTAGRIIRNTDASGRQLAYGTEKYFEAEDGLNVVLTLDEVLQHYLEKALERAYQATGAKRTMAIAMDPNTGDVLAMAIYPGYDLNNPRVPVLEEDLEEYNLLTTNEERTGYWNKMWRNSLISDTYEPGSTFKLITTAVALEEGCANLKEGFYCSGYFTVADWELRCWRYYAPHGLQSLAQAVQNSCNPVFATLGARIGLNRYYEYLELFGFTQRTGIDFTGEAYPILQTKEAAGEAGLATMSYGHGISVSPIQLITAISSIVNGGELMKPRIVDKIIDDEGNVIYTAEKRMVRRTISEQTSLEMRDIMESVVNEGTAGGAYIPGYRVGGKTGTANKVGESGGYSENAVYSSFVGFAPIDNPKIGVLFIVDEPEGNHFASSTAVPFAKEFLADALPHLNIEPQYTAEEEAALAQQTIGVSNVVGYSVDAAHAALSRQGFQVVVQPETQDGTAEVVDQFPKAGTRVDARSTVVIYTQ